MPIIHATPESSTLAPDPRPLEIDQALEVLRKTRDGDDLAPRDLKLLENVVNYGREGLTNAEMARWDEVVSQVEKGEYLKPWFHEIEHLTRDHGGYVRWKDVVVEHYSFGDPVREKGAAMRLAANCRYLEAHGREVSIPALYKASDEARHGQGLGVKRWLVIWVTEAHRARCEVVEVEAEAHADCMTLSECAVEGRVADWGSAPHAVRHLKVVTRENFDSAVAQLQQACDWARRSLRWAQYSNGRHAVEMLGQLRGTIPREELPLEDELMHRYFAGEGESVEPVLGDRVRER